MKNRIAALAAVAALWGARAPAQAQEKFKERYNADLKVGDAGFSGLKIFYLKNISLVPEGGDTLLTIANFEAKISFRKFQFTCWYSKLS